ncbi:MAG: hypothetical protein M5U34_21410 [Chloroflexi bacterium]|nr:hypothetical protein [Chloroflexota bacterium]
MTAVTWLSNLQPTLWLAMIRTTKLMFLFTIIRQDKPVVSPLLPMEPKGNDTSTRSSISVDGRYVTFDSDASNLVSDDTNNRSDVFVYDRQTGQTSRISITSDGTQGDNSSWSPSISADGRYVAFESTAWLVDCSGGGIAVVSIFLFTIGRQVKPPAFLSLLMEQKEVVALLCILPILSPTMVVM